MKLIRKIFKVKIYDNYFDVYSIEGKEHAGLNGEPTSWWLYFSDPMPDGVMPPIDSPYWKPWHSSIERHVWEIKITQKNTTKEKWGETQFRSNTWIQMICNGKVIHEFSTTGGNRGMSFAMAKIQYLQVKMSEHPYNFFDPESENGRKIYYHGLPATIRPSFHPGEIHIIPDYTAGLTKEQWWKELERRQSPAVPKEKDDMDEIEKENSEDDRRSDYINWGSALSDGNINWFRR